MREVLLSPFFAGLSGTKQTFFGWFVSTGLFLSTPSVLSVGVEGASTPAMPLGTSLASTHVAPSHLSCEVPGLAGTSPWGPENAVAWAGAMDVSTTRLRAEGLGYTAVPLLRPTISWN